MVCSARWRVHRTRVQGLVVCWTAVRVFGCREPCCRVPCLRAVIVSCRLMRRGDSVNNPSRTVRYTIVAVLLVAATAHAPAPANAPSNASPDFAQLPSLPAKTGRTDQGLHECAYLPP